VQDHHPAAGEHELQRIEAGCFRGCVRLVEGAALIVGDPGVLG
jgi:hypothetical protein